MGFLGSLKRLMTGLVGLILLVPPLLNSLMGSPVEVAAPNCPFTKGYIDWFAFFKADTTCADKVIEGQQTPFFSGTDITFIVIGFALLVITWRGMKKAKMAKDKVEFRARRARGLIDDGWSTDVAAPITQDSGYGFPGEEKNVDLDPDLAQSAGYDPSEKPKRRKRGGDSSNKGDDDSQFYNPFDF